MSIPYIPLYVADYEADTAHLTLEEDGAYLRLLRLCWRTPGCSVPDDPRWIMRKMRVSADDYYRVIEPLIDEFFTRGMGRVFSARLQREQERVEETSRKRSAAGQKGGRPAKVLKTNEPRKSRAKANGKQPEPEPDKNPIVPFDEFWQAFPSAPRKTDKPKAKVAFERIVSGKHKQIEQTDPAKIVEGVRRFSRSNPDPDFVPLPTTWLNGARWENHTTETTGADFGAFGKGEVVR